MRPAGQELTAVRFDDAGLQVAVGTQNGLVGVYDLRSQRPVVVKDHMYGSKIVDIKFHASPGDAGGNSRRQPPLQQSQVNARMAAKLMAQEAEAAAAAAGDPAAIAALKKKGALPQSGEAAPVPNIMADKRFGAMFEDADFMVDENAEEYRALHPNAGHRAKAKTEEERLLQEHFEQVHGIARMGECKPSKGPAMYAAKDAASLQAFQRRESRADALELPLAERVGRDRNAAGSSNPGARLGGSREIKFVPHMAPDGAKGKGRGGGKKGRGRR
ncbi:hypothetical protein DUNSADRAFT_13468 [Dunaliella salina]|uniref:Uncharacterized protein n=1 Tax=Dunaliella salina TaxID=3046 RepID=A0ABQ7G9E2_DUNSA|nr:hypothetical protein DUNSADRAFT_13468 [Dunaliella salina]|eukprot:KAF5831191.1 hypothetical protein DUNSADRAFT_13468 [Dunaliella salina]